MKKSTKGAAAAAAAAALLLGGAGSLAFWTDSVTLPGATATAGELKLSDPVCTGWTLDDDEDAPNAPVTASTLFVPGDIVTQSCTTTITATGEHLRATLNATNPTLDPNYAQYVSVVPSFDINGSSVGEITEANNGQTLTLNVTATFLPGAGNETQGQSVTLSDYTIALNQIHR